MPFLEARKAANSSSVGGISGVFEIDHTTELMEQIDPNYRHLLFQHNIQTFIEQSWHFLQHANFFKVSDEEAMLLTQTNSLDAATDQLLQRTNGVFTITLGKDGTLLGLNGKKYIIESIPIKPVDTTGAGDAFVGAVLYQLRNHTKQAILNIDYAGWETVIRNGNKAGARTCEYLGAMEAFKHLTNQIFQ